MADSKSERGTMVGGRFPNGGYLNPTARRIRYSSRQRSTIASLESSKLGEANRMLVTQWVVGFWIQPIDKS